MIQPEVGPEQSHANALPAGEFDGGGVGVVVRLDEQHLVAVRRVGERPELLVSDAAQEYTGPELEFLGAAMKLCPNVGCVLTKTDLYPHWRQIVEANKVHLQRANLGIPMIPAAARSLNSSCGRAIHW